MSSGARRRAERLEAFEAERRRAREPSEVSKYARELLNRCAAAKAGRSITPELEAEFRAFGEALDRPRGRDRGEGRR